MNLKKYIENGNLDNYAFGNATADEQKEVIRLAEKHDEVAHALLEAEETLANYASLYAVTPPTSLKETLMRQINDEAEVFIPIHPEVRSKTSKRTYMWAVAAVLLITISVSANIYIIQQLWQTEASLSALIIKQGQLADENTLNKTNYTNALRELSLLKTPGLSNVLLKGLDIAPNAEATVYWNKRSSNVYIAIHNLPAPPPGKQYQLWALNNNEPKSVGLIPLELQFGMVLPMSEITQADAFAISLERYGGADFPTVDAIYAMGSL